MISRFNLDQKRLNFYENTEQFNEDFIKDKSIDNKEEFLIEIHEPTIVINKEKTLKLTLIKKEKEFDYILFSNHSISLLPSEKLKVHKALKEISSFEIFKLKD
mgnify:CR=1 FL=1|tara:strand:- start:1049 stop:1357 length:309 start_codon:yes stop_codon:yes gene_type:complete